MTTVTPHRQHPSASTSLPACHVEADSRRARHVDRSLLSERALVLPRALPAPYRPRTRARAPPPHVGASPSLPPPPPPPTHPLPALSSKSGSQSRWCPGFPPPPFSLPHVWPPPHAPSDCSPFARGRAPGATRGGAAAVAALCPRHGTCSGGRRRKLDSGAAALPGGSPPPAPATSRSTSGSFRSPPLSSLGRTDGRAAAAAGALTTPPAGNRGPCSAGGLGAAEVSPRGQPSSLHEGWSSEGRTQFIPCNSLNSALCFCWGKASLQPRCWKSASSCPLWPLEKFGHASSLSGVVSTIYGYYICSCLLHLQPHDSQLTPLALWLFYNAQALSSSRL